MVMMMMIAAVVVAAAATTPCPPSPKKSPSFFRISCRFYTVKRDMPCHGISGLFFIQTFRGTFDCILQPCLPSRDLQCILVSRMIVLVAFLPKSLPKLVDVNSVKLKSRSILPITSTYSVPHCDSWI